MTNIEKRKIVEATIKTLKEKDLLKEQDEEKIKKIKKAIKTVGLDLKKCSFDKIGGSVVARYEGANLNITVKTLSDLQTESGCFLNLTITAGKIYFSFY